MRSHLRALLTHAIDKTAQGAGLNATEIPPVLLEPPKQREFGDLASNVAMLWAKSARKPPRVIAETILKNIEDPEGILARKEIAGPGFLNFAFAPKFYFQRLREIDAGKGTQVNFGRGQRVQVEFASVNPTGPLHVGHGRVAVIGDVLAPFPALRGITERVLLLKDMKLKRGRPVEDPDPAGPTLRTVSGQLRPRLTIAPGELQLWRIGNIE